MVEADLVKIVTTGGTTYYNPSDPVLTKAGVATDGRMAYVIQSAAHLRPGQQVAWDKQYVNVTLEQIAEGLTTEPTYAAAQAATFITNSQGQLIPRFREFLIKGLYQLAQRGNKEIAFLGRLDERALDAMIKREGQRDFSQSEYHAMTDEIHKYVELYNEIDGLPFVTQAAVRKWLKGETIGPRDNEILIGLKELNPKFEEYTSVVPGERNLWEHYKIWVVVRQGLRSHFASLKAHDASTPQDAIKHDDNREAPLEKGRHITLTPFLKHLLDRFYQEVSNQHVNVLVTSIEPVHVAGSKDGRNSIMEAITDVEKGGPVPHLYKGLCRERPAGLDAFVVPKDSIVTARTLIADAIEFGLRRYLRVPEIKQQVIEIAKSFGTDFNTTNLELNAEDNMFLLLSSYLHTSTNHELMEAQSRAGNKEAQAIKATGELLLQHDYEGMIDAALRLPLGTFAAAIDTLETINRLLPDEYHQIRLNLVKIAVERTFLGNIAEFRTQDKPGNMLEKVVDSILYADSKLKKDEAAAQQEIEQLEAANQTLKSKLDFDYDATQKMTLLYDITGFVRGTDTDPIMPIEQALGNERLVQTLACMVIIGGRRESYARYDDSRGLFASIGLPKKLLDLIPTNLFIDKVKISDQVREAVKQSLR